MLPNHVGLHGLHIVVRCVGSVVGFLGVLLLGTVTLAYQDPATKVFLNGVPTAVTFNDGDSFRVLDGPLMGTKARLSHFNTLESFGPTHSWGTWNAYELYINAKMATMNARRGVWHCVSADLARDGYGRILWYCDDLARDQISKGFAHAMSIDHTPASPELLALQREAIAAKRGMWAHGVPEFVLTSLHSAGEYATKQKALYNRLVSTRDGHSDPWTHHDTYHECQKICHEDTRVDLERMTAAVQSLRHDDAVNKVLIPSPDDTEMQLLVSMYTRLHLLPDWTPKEAIPVLTERLDGMRKAGQLGTVITVPGACMVYVDFTRRYGLNRAACLQHP